MMTWLTVTTKILRITIIGAFFSVIGLDFMDMCFPRFTSYHSGLATIILVSGAVGLNELWIKKGKS